MNKKQNALNYLKNDLVLNISMIEPIKRNTSDILYVSDKGVLIYEKKSESYMLSTYDVELASKLIDTLERKGMFVVHQKELFDLVKEKFGYNEYFECYNVAYINNVPPKISNEYEIKLLEDKDKAIVREIYKSIDTDFDYTSYLIDEKQMWGTFENNILMGFIGMHSEGSCGLLEVIPEYRNRGIGQALQLYLCNYVIKKGWTPFGQVFIDNDKSLNLQKKLGLQISDKTVFWMYN